ncbi:hypothetical protein RLW55_06125 [Hyphomicrobium sp. B1]|jgi:hypothetical protein
MRVLGANMGEPHRLIRTLRDLDHATRYQQPTVVTAIINSFFRNAFAD